MQNPELVNLKSVTYAQPIPLSLIYDIKMYTLWKCDIAASSHNVKKITYNLHVHVYESGLFCFKSCVELPNDVCTLVTKDKHINILWTIFM